LQIEMDFADNEQPGKGSAAARPPVLGIITGRTWVPAITPSLDLLRRMQRDLPLDRSVSERLLLLLAARGVTDAGELERFFFPRMEHLHDPLLLDEIEPAVRRLLAAAGRGERVAVHGDFDVDGLTGTALLAELVGALTVDGRRAELLPPFVPDRADGYGVVVRQLRRWGEQGAQLLLTVDTGSAARDELNLARELGMDVVVLDHHLFAARPEAALALVNPCRPDNSYPNPELCGVGVAFKFAQAVTALAPESLPGDFADSVVDLAALGLIADQMPIVGENRTLVLKGLGRINDRAANRPGLAALLAVAGLDNGFPVTATSLAFQLVPRLNACGRVGDVRVALELLLTDDPGVARRLAREADVTNQKRKQADQAVKLEAARLAEPFVERGDPGLALASPNWHRGVIGISASRLVEMFNVPTILFAVEGDEARGSARSLPGVDVKSALDRCAHLLVRYGGHAQAAGATLPSADIDAFRASFLAALAEVGDGAPVTEPYDLELPLAEMEAGEVANFTRELAQLEPFGEGNRSPVFRCGGLRLGRLPANVGADGQHLRFSFAGPGGAACAGTPALSREFISFGSGPSWREFVESASGERRDLMDRRWDILFRLSPNYWRPRNGASVDPVQQQLIDIRPAATP